MAAPATSYARPAQFDRASQHRRAMIAKINIARHQLQMIEDDYRQVLFNATGRTSLKECGDAQLERMLDRLKALGFQPLPKAGGRSPAAHPMARKARALWISLHQLGVVRNPSEEALEAFAKRQLGCERLVWARQSDAYRLIEALKAMAKRAGWPQRCLATGKDLSIGALQEGLCNAILRRLKDAGVAAEPWTLNDAAFKLCGIEVGRNGPMTGEGYTRLAAALGSKLREAAPAGGELA
jgi:phage gp16-like protein